MSSQILLTFENSEVNLSSGTEAEAAAYQLSWGERSVLKGQVKGLAVLYLVCAVDWRIQTLQIAKGGFVAVTENDRSTEHREKEKPLVTERFKKKLCYSKTPCTRFHEIPLLTVGRGHSLYFHCFLAIQLWKLSKWQRNARGRWLQCLFSFLFFIFNSKFKTMLKK